MLINQINHKIVYNFEVTWSGDINKARYKQSTFKDLKDDGHLQVKINGDDHLQVTIITIF